MNANDFDSGSNWIRCRGCGQERCWYYFPGKKGRVTKNICFTCIEKLKIREVKSKLYRLVMAAEKNKMVDLREDLFQCLELVKTKQMGVEEAKAACMIAQTIINSAKVEIDFIKMIGGPKKSAFLEIEAPQE